MENENSRDLIQRVTDSPRSNFKYKNGTRFNPKTTESEFKISPQLAYDFTKLTQYQNPPKNWDYANEKRRSLVVSAQATQENLKLAETKKNVRQEVEQMMMQNQEKIERYLRKLDGEVSKVYSVGKLSQAGYKDYLKRDGKEIQKNFLEIKDVKPTMLSSEFWEESYRVEIKNIVGHSQQG
jgi:hypothetical protein